MTLGEESYSADACPYPAAPSIAPVGCIRMRSSSSCTCSTLVRRCKSCVISSLEFCAGGKSEEKGGQGPSRTEARRGWEACLERHAARRVGAEEALATCAAGGGRSRRTCQKKSSVDTVVCGQKTRVDRTQRAQGGERYFDVSFRVVEAGVPGIP